MNSSGRLAPDSRLASAPPSQHNSTLCPGLTGWKDRRVEPKEAGSEGRSLTGYGSARSCRRGRLRGSCGSGSGRARRVVWLGRAGPVGATIAIGPLPRQIPRIDAVFAPDGSAYATEAVSTCEIDYGVGPCQSGVRLFRYRKNGALDSAFGDSGSVALPDGTELIAADAGGRALVANRREGESSGCSRAGGLTRASGAAARWV